MKRLLLAVFIMVCGIFTSSAQTGELLIKDSGKGLYIEHKVAPKENFYSIGRSFYVNPRHLASFNSLDMSKGLSVGQVLRIPLSDTNFNQKTDKGTPVYYTVGTKEGLMTVSNHNNKVLLASLRKWNHLSSDQLSAGRKLIVGYLAEGEVKNDVAVNTTKTEIVTPPAAEEKKEETKQIKEEEKKDTEIVQVKNEERPAQGYFKSFFDQQVKQDPVKKDLTVTSGVFKTSSGWSDQKYYLLVDGVEPGTVIKITNPSNNTIIYAKVLGEMNGIKQNQGLNIRISNAAAAALAVGEADKFIVKLNY